LAHASKTLRKPDDESGDPELKQQYIIIK